MLETAVGVLVVLRTSVEVELKAWALARREAPRRRLREGLDEDKASEVSRRAEA